MINIASRMFNDGFDETLDADGLIADYESEILKLRAEDANGSVHIKQSLKAAFKHIQDVYNNKEATIGLSTGFRDLDEKTSGFRKSDLILIAGRPSQGKSALMQNMIQTISIDNKKPSLLFSAEMSSEMVTMRILAAESGVSLHNISTGKMAESSWPKLTIAAGRISEAPIILDDKVGLSISELRAKAHQAIAQYGIEVIFVDYLQLLNAGNRHNTRNEEMGAVSLGLKALGRDMNIPIVAASQLNRKCEDRPDKRPKMSDLRESGNLEQDADLVIFLYRDSHYNKDATDDTTELIIGKQRNGPTGTVRVMFDRPRMRFRDLAQGDSGF